MERDLLKCKLVGCFKSLTFRLSPSFNPEEKHPNFLGQKDSCARGGKLRIATGDAKTGGGGRCAHLENFIIRPHQPPDKTEPWEAGRMCPSWKDVLEHGHHSGTHGR